MSNILATWICIDDKEDASWFPSTKGNSSDQKIQDIYWRCLAVSMHTARFHNPDIKLAVFSNIDKLPVVEGVNFIQVFKDLKIDFYTTPFEYKTPNGYYKEWKNQFYEFSILKYIVNHSDFDEEDNFCLIDSDCIISGDLSPMYSLIDEFHFLGYNLNYNEDHIINGNSRLDMKEIYQKLLNASVEETPVYYAGEYFAAKIGLVRKLLDEFYLTWDKLMELYDKGEVRLHEEAHVLSFLYYKTGCENSHANQFVKRMWTTTYRNIEKNDTRYLIWHLPAEKIYGFKKMFYWLFSPKTKLISSEILHRKTQTFFTVPYLPLKLRVFYSMKRIGKKILKK